MENKSLNQITLLIFAPLLILSGIAGFVIPAQYSLMSNATPYNLFHILFGAIGLLLLQTKSDLVASSFNLGFGLIDLYQVLASVLKHLGPAALDFRGRPRAVLFFAVSLR